MRKLSLITVATVLLAALAAGCARSTALEVRDAWARPAAAGGTGAVYFVLDNPGDQAAALVAASAEVAEGVELHLSQMDSNGTMSMHHQPEVPIPAGTTVEFEPGGLHVMLINLVDDLQVGDTFPLTLTFQGGSPMTVDVTVRDE